jgi:hypothetical protein
VKKNSSVRVEDEFYKVSDSDTDDEKERKSRPVTKPGSFSKTV